MDENLNQQNWGSANNNERPMPPPPPPPEITLRTMQSDLESIKQAGGENPIPKSFTPSETKKENTMELEDLSKEEGMIKPSNTDGVLPPAEPPKKKFKLFILIAVLVLVITGAVYAGYVYIYPMFSKPVISVDTPPLPTTAATENSVAPETIPPATIEPVAATTIEESVIVGEGELATTTEELATTTPETTLPPVVLKLHSSFLIVPSDSSAPILLSGSTTLSSIRSVLVSEASNKPEAETALKEMVLSNEGGQLIFADILPLFVSELSLDSVSPLFEEDFTSVISYDKNGAWFGMIAKLKEGADVVAAKTLIAKLEKSAGLANLYIQDPGTQSAAGFKDGKANNLATRYITFSKAGASLNYGWTSNNLLVISTSYNGIKAMLTNLGIQ